MRDLDWVRALHDDLWPPDENPRKFRVALEASRTLSKDEWSRLLKVIEEERLVVQLIGTSMFGGYGIRLFEHPSFPGLPPEFVATIIEDHLPLPTRYEHALGEVKPIPKKRSGQGRDDAWEVFSKMSLKPRNIEWLKEYGLELPQDRSHYDY